MPVLIPKGYSLSVTTYFLRENNNNSDSLPISIQSVNAYAEIRYERERMNAAKMV